MQHTFIEKQVYMPGIIGSYISIKGKKGLIIANFLAFLFAFIWASRSNDF